MFKRVTWTAVGYGLGLGTSVYLQRRVRRAVERYTPEHVRHDLARRGRDTADRLRAAGTTAAGAVREGRAVMRAHEIDLRREFLRAEPPEPPRARPLHR